MSNLTISYHREGDVHQLETGAGALGKITIDNTDVPVEERGGTAKQLLGASALFCYCSALVGALDARGANYSNLEARAILEVGGNEKGQGRVKKISIEANVALPEEDADIFERCQKIMSQGCLVTGSLHDGIEMNYALSADYQE